MVKIITLSEHEYFDGAYWGMGCTDSELYFGLCSHQPQKSAGLFKYNPISGQVNKIFNISDLLSEKDSQFQGKIHTPIFSDKNQVLYFGTHFAYPYGVPQNLNFSGGHIISFDTKTSKTKDYGIAVPHEGIQSMAFNENKMVLYFLTAPSGFFVSLNINNGKFKNHGKIVTQGSLCRSLVLDNNNNVYGSIEPNKIFKFNWQRQKLEILPVAIPNSGKEVPEWSSPSRGGVNKIGRNIWRTAIYNVSDNSIYGIEATSSSIFKLELNNIKISSVCYLGPEEYKNNLEKIYPTLSLSLYKNDLFYSPAAGFFDYSRSESISKFSHLIKYSLISDRKTDMGVLTDKNGRRVYGVAGSTFAPDGTFYLLGAVEVLEKEVSNPKNVIQKQPFHLGLVIIK